MNTRVLPLVVTSLVASSLTSCVMPPLGSPYPLNNYPGVLSPPVDPYAGLRPAPTVQSAASSPELAEQLKNVRKARQDLHQLAVKVKHDPRATVEFQAQSARLYEGTRRDWHDAGTTIIRELRSGSTHFTEPTNAAIDRAKASQQSFVRHCASLENDRLGPYSFLTVMAIQFVNEFVLSYRAAIERGEQQRFEAAVQQEFELTPWQAISAY